MENQLHQAVHSGIKGIVYEEGGDVLSNANVFIEGKDRSISTTQRGEFWILLTPGTYKIRVGCSPLLFRNFTIISQGKSQFRAGLS